MLEVASGVKLTAGRCSIRNCRTMLLDRTKLIIRLDGDQALDKPCRLAV